MDPVNLQMIRGDTQELDVTFADDQDNPINDPGAEYRMTAKVLETDPDPGVFTVVATQSAPGVATLVINPAATSGQPPIVVSLNYDIQVTESGGRVTTIQYGRLIITPDVSTVTP